jgi:nitrite reductase (cytochrome c-552)
MRSIVELSKKHPWINWVIFLITVAVVFLIGLFASSIIDRKSESKLYFQQQKPIGEWEPRNEVWGENFPREFETYKSTIDTSFKSKYGGSSTRDYLSEFPELVVLWAGYAFAKDYSQGRGHYRAIEDIINTLRTVQPQPATCWTCKSTDIPRLMNKYGPEAFYKKKWKELGEEVVNPIGCQDCHDPKTMNLRITRPALVEAFQRQGRDINNATQQEMRSLVCAQCHVEYYFKGEGKYLTFPWDKGFSADSMEAYYDKAEFTDFVHSLSRTPIIKAQHPDYEVFVSGIHGKRGVACADCHMPYKRDGAVKFTDHKIQSPLNNISGSCQVCHRENEDTLRNNIYERQKKIAEVRRIAEINLAKAHMEAKAAWDNGASETEMKPVLILIRHAQWRWDWVAASNGMGFHSPVECLRVLSSSIERSFQARILLNGILAAHNVKQPIVYADISTKEKAQAYIKLDMKKIREEKTEFKKLIYPKWAEAARKSNKY